MNSQSIRQFMSGVKGFTSGFDYLRIVLSMAVLLWHSYYSTHGHSDIEGFLTTPGGNVIYTILPMFFALSGFLVASSLARTNHLPKFLWLRVVRLFPALSVEVVMSALILGPLVTSHALPQYFQDPLFAHYFKNLVGVVQFHLPGVFTDNLVPSLVNGSLWTVPYELECYMALSVLFLAGLTKKPRLLGAVMLALIVARTAWVLIQGAPPLPIGSLSGRSLIVFFLMGVVFYANSDLIPKNDLLGFACLVVGVCLVKDARFWALASLPIVYATISLGLMQPGRIKIIASGDYSYGIYLYAVPIQQAAWQFTAAGKTFWGNALMATVIVSLFAAFSWHAIEKPALRLKNIFAKPLAAESPSGLA